MQRSDDNLPEHVHDPELQAYLDGRLSPEAAAEVEARLAGDDTVSAAASKWHRQRELIREAAQVLDTGESNLRTAALERDLADRLMKRQRRARFVSPRLGQFAASVAIFVLGWGAHMGYERLGAPDHPDYVAEALSAHQVFAHDDLYPVEFRADEIEQAVSWLSAQMERKVDSPKLDNLGLEVVGARLLGTQNGPSGLFIYENAEGQRLSVLISPHEEGTPEISLRVSRQGEQTVAYWSDEAIDYAVLGGHDRAMLTQVAAAVSMSR
ncbi:MAG: anti-sigma factor [Chromatiaceae bacterium]|nr:MAG: anti-sigma factor [Chromatiaceae bacterium]